MATRRIHSLTLLLLLASPVAAVAQSQPVAWQRWELPMANGSHPVVPSQAIAATAPGDSPLLILGGIIGGAAGLYGGALAGYHLSGGDRLCGDDSCGLYAGILGAAVGEMALLPLGVHLANRRRGDYGLDLLASIALGVGGSALASTSDSSVLLIAVPVVQLISVVLIERATSRSRAQPHQ
jgi:hypothetical protein